jgi:hypothetical protein
MDDPSSSSFVVVAGGKKGSDDDEIIVFSFSTAPLSGNKLGFPPEISRISFR